jgi:hypothetical protein
MQKRHGNRAVAYHVGIAVKRVECRCAVHDVAAGIADMADQIPAGGCFQPPVAGRPCSVRFVIAADKPAGSAEVGRGAVVAGNEEVRHQEADIQVVVALQNHEIVIASAVKRLGIVQIDLVLCRHGGRRGQPHFTLHSVDGNALGNVLRLQVRIAHHGHLGKAVVALVRMLHEV